MGDVLCQGEQEPLTLPPRPVNHSFLLVLVGDSHLGHDVCKMTPGPATRGPARCSAINIQDHPVPAPATDPPPPVIEIGMSTAAKHTTGACRLFSTCSRRTLTTQPRLPCQSCCGWPGCVSIEWRGAALLGYRSLLLLTGEV